jgi:diaminopimelate decarboxylase
MSLFDVLPRTAAPGVDGRLAVGGCALADVAAEFGTPAFVADEQGLRDTAREYVDAFRAPHPDTHVHFASKALPCAPLLRLLAEEGLGCDVASAGELAIGLSAGFDPADMLLHGNETLDDLLARDVL